VKRSQVLAVPRLAMSVPEMLRSADTHMLLDTAWKLTVPPVCATILNFSFVPMAVCEAMSLPPFARSVVTKRPLMEACKETVPSLLFTIWKSSQLLAAARFAMRKLAPAFSAQTNMLFAEALMVAALEIAGPSRSPQSDAHASSRIMALFNMSLPPDIEFGEAWN